ncbi:MAG: hypothetical protein QXE31_03020 [Candidatus Woesearchaeota archaeon]
MERLKNSNNLLISAKANLYDYMLQQSSYSETNLNINLASLELLIINNNYILISQDLREKLTNLGITNLFENKDVLYVLFEIPNNRYRLIYIVDAYIDKNEKNKNEQFYKRYSSLPLAI